MPQPSFSQGDLVYLNYPLEMPNGDELPHPVLIISSNASNSYECYYTGVMMSATQYRDRYTFECDDNMFEIPLKKDECQIRTYVTITFREAHVDRKINKMKRNDFKELMTEIKDYVFAVDM